MRNFVAPSFALAGRAAKLSKSFEEEGLNVVRLKPSGFGTFHILTHPCNAACIHNVMRKRTLFEQVLQMRTIDCICNCLCKLCLDVRPVSVPNGFN